MLLIFSSAQSHFSAMNSAGTAIVMQAGTSAPFSGPVPPQQDTLPRPPSPYMAAIRLLSLALAFMGVLSCVAGGLGVHYVQYALDVAEWPTTSGSGAWCGSLVGTHYSECERYGVSNHRQLHYLSNSLFKRTRKETSKHRISSPL